MEWTSPILCICSAVNMENTKTVRFPPLGSKVQNRISSPTIGGWLRVYTFGVGVPTKILGVNFQKGQPVWIFWQRLGMSNSKRVTMVIACRCPDTKSGKGIAAQRNGFSDVDRRCTFSKTLNAWSRALCQKIGGGRDCHECMRGCSGILIPAVF